MSGDREFCPRCGEDLADGDGLSPPSGEAPRQARLCPSCYFETFELVSLPDVMTVHVCTSCGAVKHGNRWEDVDAADYTDVAIAEVGAAIQVHRAAEDVAWSVEPIQRGPNELELRCRVSARVHGERVVDEARVRVRIARETCTRCGQIAGDHYAGTVQIRAAGGRVPTRAETDRGIEIAHEVIEEMQATGNREAFVSDVVDRAEGVDIRVSTNAIAAKVAGRLTDELGGSYESSERLVTEDADGERVYRVAFAVRLPALRDGDIVDPSDGAGPVLVQGGPGTTRGRRLTTGEEVTLDPGSTDRLGTIEDAVETTVVTVEDEHAVQVLDPETAAATTIPRPTDLSADTESVHVFRTREGLYVVPRRSIEEGSPA